MSQFSVVDSVWISPAARALSSHRLDGILVVESITS
jgi:hypothetical protein